MERVGGAAAVFSSLKSSPKIKVETMEPGPALRVLLTSSKMRFLARVIAELRALIQDSFSSGLTARKIRFGAYKRGNSGQCQ